MIRLKNKHNYCNCQSNFASSRLTNKINFIKPKPNPIMKKLFTILALVSVFTLSMVGCTEEEVKPSATDVAGTNASAKGF